MVPSLACRILELIPAEYELRDTPLAELPADTYFEEALARTDSGREFIIFDPCPDRGLVGRRIQVELAGPLATGSSYMAGLKKARATWEVEPD